MNCIQRKSKRRRSCINSKWMQSRADRIKSLRKRSISPEEKQKLLDAELIDASLYGDAERVRNALKRGADKLATDKSGNSPLTIATVLGHREVTEVFLEYQRMLIEDAKRGFLKGYIYPGQEPKNRKKG